MNDDLWDSVRGLDSETCGKGVNELSFSMLSLDIVLP